ncbi:DUF3105 domain-containing protein [Cryobacterium sp.]|uniref:DUF3105 domain-containing protein n=1 Tax=Cryobacterium sp. TaxID=1926290 RepID=UPI002633BC71|nr:DUF3105 domain-containing protein [Cryobacterium sp.]MCU1445982.1 hypothetical protein [Cryobacterium sp.]
MTPAPPTGPSGSSSAKPGVKQQRAQQRAQKLEQYHREQKRSARNRRIGLIAGITAGVAVVGILVTSIVLTPQSVSYSAGGDGTSIDGVETFENASLHVETPVTYPQTPPAGGEHNPTWLNCGVYTEAVPNENAVHSLEHGALWVTYDPAISDAELATLKAVLPSTYLILSPFEGLPSPIVVSGWNTQLQVESADDERVAAFIEEYWKSNDVPEPGALCTGAYDAPGKV